jgi:hypothetical protein
VFACLALLALAPVLAHSQDADSVVVTWSAPGDDGSIGIATAYDLRMSLSPITEADFDAATPVAGVPAPATTGTRQRASVRGLVRGTTYYFAIRTVDDAGNWSAISNVLRWDWILDTSPPAAPSGLSARLENQNVRLSWSENAEPDLSGYRVYRAPSAGGPYVALNGSLLGTAGYTDGSVPADAAAVWYQVTAWDAAGNESARSRAVSLALRPVAAESAIESAYPNPSQAGSPVRIPVELQRAGSGTAVVDVLDSGGRRVCRIDLSALSPGRQDVLWDGKNDAGREVAPGVYRAWLIVGGSRSSIRLVRLP